MWEIVSDEEITSLRAIADVDGWDRLVAENARLRAALEWIADEDESKGADMAARARTALAAEETKG